MIRKSLLLLLLLGPAAVGARAQSNYQPGYVLTPAGDTLRGLLDYRGERRNSRLCHFRATADAPVMEYRPEQLHGYGLRSGARYQTITVRLPKPAVGTADSVTLPVFAEVLVQGPATLLYLHDPGDAVHYYLRKPSGPAQELVQRVRNTTTPEGRPIRQQSDEYRRTLAAATADCYAVQPALVKLPLQHNALIRVVEEYNRCVGATVEVPASARRRIHARLVAVAGGQRSVLVYKTLNGVNAYSGSGFHNASRAQPVAGLALHLDFSDLNRNLAGRAELLYEHQLFRGQLSDGANELDLRTELSAVQLPLFLRYTIPTNIGLRPYVQAGLVFRYLTQVRSEVRAKPLTGGRDYSAWETLFTNPRHEESGLSGAVGLTTLRPQGRNLALELRHERSNGFSSFADFNATQRRWYLLLSYDLTR